MHYIVIARDFADAQERRQQARPAHLELAKTLKAEGKLLYAVALIENGQMKGSVMVMHFATPQELETWKANEPYISGNVWEKIEISQCAIPPLFS